MTISTRFLLAASLCLAPLGWAVAQDQPQQPPDQHRREHQEQHQPQQQQQQQHAPQQQPHAQQAPQTNAPPQGQHAGAPRGGNPQFQRPAQTNAAPPSPPPGATASPTPPPSQSQQRFQTTPQNRAAAPATTAPQPLQQPPQPQFQQRSVQRGGAAGGAGAPQVQSQQQAPQQTTTTRGNFQGAARSPNTAAFTQRHGGYAPAQFDRGHFYGRDYDHFSSHEAEMWHRGAWRHEFHDGRYGWWYAVDGIWYFYDAPIYPYPTYIPDVVYIPEEDDAPPPDYVDAPYEPGPPPPAQYGQPPAYDYYFCPDSQTYYPYVTSCASPWQPVPAVPQPQ